MKTLILLEGNKPIPTHNLKKLFKALRGKTQKELEQGWLSDIPTQHMIAEFSKATGDALPTDLRSALESGGTAFQYLRYAHQTDLSQTKFFLGNLPRLLRQVIHRRKPEWVNLGPSYGPLPVSQAP
ncbi:hypothetical protein AUC70_13850 [Methyloceanibacter stevinii]|uniref:Uncharacterized protein n=1 Tax=Methyloceanibacter stevinii TaxID=1774970 RepID=A0A1E3VTN4_9HYPH|nr:hypothetical protein [Methyloceanibacter stevinii]ODR96865.1 hypothetical protein AUC70_13850 [Methyloceanibacter stevinii]